MPFFRDRIRRAEKTSQKWSFLTSQAVLGTRDVGYRCAVRMMVEELLEGGRDAFNPRRYLYGF